MASIFSVKEEARPLLRKRVGEKKAEVQRKRGKGEMIIGILTSSCLCLLQHLYSFSKYVLSVYHVPALR